MNNKEHHLLERMIKSMRLQYQEEGELFKLLNEI